MNKFFCSVLALACCLSLHASEDDFDRALSLYNSGLYAQAMDLFQSLPSYGNNAEIDGYVVLCAQKQHSTGYEKLVDSYLGRYSSSSLCKDVRKELAYDLFDKAEYAACLDILTSLREKDYARNQRAEYFFKTAYCQYMLGRNDNAVKNLTRVTQLEMNDYTAPAQYLIAYLDYGKGNFAQALELFLLAARDERMASISNYYIINCHYEMDDYDYVISDGVKMFSNDKTPADRKAHLARIISESYLVKGDKENARKFYNDAQKDASEKSRADYFYAGSLLFATGEYKEAIENYGKMTEKTDSLGQIAWYQTALSYLNLKNKVSALDSFKQAANTDFDPQMTEDAYFNWAKLAFDLNGDTSVFGSYIKKYSDKVRGEMIYSYMALAALADKDYQAAIDAYDKIDVLEGQDKNNYVRANYLRGAELLDNGSYRKAADNMKAVTYYTEKTDPINQLARYALADSYYRNEQYDMAGKQYTELYNASALDGMPQGELMPYNVAYSHFKNADYENAYKWFGTYTKNGGKTYLKDALLRSADCQFALKKYPDAAAAYLEFSQQYADANDIYPYYQAGICYGLAADTKNKKQNIAFLAKKIAVLQKVENADSSAAYFADALFELGRTYQTAGKRADALKTFQSVINRAPASPFAAQSYLEIGTIKRNSGDAAGALEVYKTVVEKMPDSGYYDDALLAIESIYQSQNAPQKYLAYLDSIGKGASKSEEEREDMIFSAAQQIFFADNYAQAIAAFQNFQKEYPSSAKNNDATYFIAESYRFMGDKERACDTYLLVMQADGQSKYKENATRQYAALNYAMENFDKAYEAYTSLMGFEMQDAARYQAAMGQFRSACKARMNEKAVEHADAILAMADVNPADAREVKMAKAKSLLAMSRRDDAFAVLEDLSAEVKYPEGAEAAYMIIVDCFDRGDFDAVRDKVYAMADSGTSEQYYLAKAFIVLGDSFAEQGKLKQAQATFKSIAEGYSENDEINEELQIRLNKLEETL